MSDSMAPGLRAGDVVVVRPVAASAVRLGQVVLAVDPDAPGRLRLHRLDHREGADLVLKGDANAAADSAPIAPGAVRGVGFLRVPLIGLPILWLRTGAWPLALAAVAGVLLLAAAVRLLEDGRPGAARRRRALLAAGLVGAVAVAAPAQPASSWSAFSSVSSSPNDSIASSTFDCPSRSALPTPGFYYSFMPASGSSEPNLGNAGSQFSATVTPASIRVGGTCNSGASPYLRFTGNGSEAVVGNSGVAATGSATQSIWFSPASAVGVLEDIGGSAGTTASQADRQLYLNSSGQLAFAIRDSGTATGCSITSTTVSLNQWHLAVATFDNTAKRYTLYLDGSGTSCTGTITTPSSLTGYVRIGRDAAIASNASTGSYSGGVDEVGAWGSVLTAANVQSIWTTGH